MSLKRLKVQMQKCNTSFSKIDERETSNVNAGGKGRRHQSNESNQSKEKIEDATNCDIRKYLCLNPHEECDTLVVDEDDFYGEADCNKSVQCICY